MKSMTRQECEEKIVDLMKQIVDVLLEFQPNECDFVGTWDSEDGYIGFYNGDFKDASLVAVDGFFQYRKDGAK